MCRNKTSISNAQIPQEIGEFWDSHSLADYWGKGYGVYDKRSYQKPTITKISNLNKEWKYENNN